MSKSKRKPRTASSYRAPVPASEPVKRGFFDTLMAPRTGPPAPMPSIRSSIARGFVTVISTPAIVAWVAGVAFVQWVVLVSLGFQGPFTYMAAAVSWPGPGTYLDGQLAAVAFGSTRGSLFSVFIFIIVRGVVLAVLTTMSVETLRTGGVSAWSVRRTLHVLPAAITANMVGLGLLLVASVGGQFLGQLGLGFLVFVAGLVAAVWLTASAPAIAADEDRGLAGTMQRAYRIARVPGSGSLTIAALYAIPSFAVTSVYAFGGDIGVNPTPARWAITIGLNLIHATAAVMFAYRYLASAPFIDEAPKATRRPRR